MGVKDSNPYQWVCTLNLETGEVLETYQVQVSCLGNITFKEGIWMVSGDSQGDTAAATESANQARDTFIKIIKGLSVINISM